MRYLFSILFFTTSIQLFGQNQSKLKIFYDCNAWNCNETYVKQNLPEVEFVRDRNFADVHILIVSETNGSGGQTYHIDFIGQNEFKDVQEKLSFSTGTDDTQEQIREKLLKYLKLGLMKFWLKNGIADKISLEILSSQQEEKPENDQWNNWVFSIGANGYFSGSSNAENIQWGGYMSAKQIKEKNKFALYLNYNKSNSTYKYNDMDIKSEKEFFSLQASEILGINQHWSYGFFTRFDRSKFSNYKFATELYAGLEYNFFPYKESSKKSLTIGMKTGALYNKYFEQTVYNKTEENLFRSQLFLNGRIVKKWGNMHAGFQYKTYLHDLKLNSMGFSFGTNLRIAKGLNYNTYAYYGINHDQINIAAGNLSLEETLLAQKELQSGYEYYVMMGLSYSFGSIYNTIVNTRFDGSSGGGRRTVIYF